MNAPDAQLLIWNVSGAALWGNFCDWLTWNAYSYAGGDGVNQEMQKDCLAEKTKVILRMNARANASEMAVNRKNGVGVCFLADWECEGCSNGGALENVNSAVAVLVPVTVPSSAEAALLSRSQYYECEQTS